jgi:hypothetical protein
MGSAEFQRGAEAFADGAADAAQGKARVFDCRCGATGTGGISRFACSQALAGATRNGVAEIRGSGAVSLHRRSGSGACGACLGIRGGELGIDVFEQAASAVFAHDCLMATVGSVACATQSGGPGSGFDRSADAHAAIFFDFDITPTGVAHHGEFLEFFGACCEFTQIGFEIFHKIKNGRLRDRSASGCGVEGGSRIGS